MEVKQRKAEQNPGSPSVPCTLCTDPSVPCPHFPPTSTVPVAPPSTVPVAPPSTVPVAPPGAVPVAPPGTVPVAPPSTVPVAPFGAVPVAPPSTVPVAPPSTVPVAPPSTVPVAPPSTVPVAPPGAVLVAPPSTVPVAPFGTVPVAPPGTVLVAPPGAVLVAPFGTVPVAPPGAVPVAHDPWKAFRVCWTYRGIFVLLVLPVVMLPLALGDKVSRCSYVLILMALFWSLDVLPLAVTALLPAVLFPVLGLMESRDVCSQYLKDTNMLFVGGLMVAVAVERWNLHKRIALNVLVLMGATPGLLMLGFMLVTAFLSMWISNTATTAMMVPIVRAVLDQLEGQSTLSAAGAEEGAGQSVRQELPRAEDTQSSQSERKDDSRSPAVGQGYRDLQEFRGLLLGICYASSIGGTATLNGTGPNLVLNGQMHEIFPENEDVINFASWFFFAFPNMILMLFLSWLWLQFLFVGANPFKLCTCDALRTVRASAAGARLREELQSLGSVSFGEASMMVLFFFMVVMWFTRDPGYMNGWATETFNAKGEFVTDATVSVFMALLLFLLPARLPYYVCFWRKDRERLEGPSTGLLTWEFAQKKLPWNVIILLGGGFALAKGSEVSGLSAYLVDLMTPLRWFPPWIIVFTMSLLISTITECSSNVATAALFLPIVASMARSTDMNPLYVMIPCTLCSSFAFMLPVSTPPNAIVFSSGLLQASDMLRAGVVLNIIGIICVTLSINTWGYQMFDLGTFPAWAREGTGKILLHQ